MLKLFYSPGACSLASHIVLEELAVNYEAIKVDLKTHQYNKEDFYKINPAGTVPTLVLADGQILTQNLAILYYLGELDTKRQLIPPEGSIERLRWIEWMGFVNSDLHKTFSSFFKLGSILDSVAAQEEFKKKIPERVAGLFKLTDAKLAGKQFALGNYFSTVDAYLLVMYRWASVIKLDTSAYPHYTALAQRITSRQATQKALKAEGLL